MSDTCGYTVIRDGEEAPCDRPCTGWRWYQNVEHEDMLDTACDLHENEGGKRMHAAESELDRLRADVTGWKDTYARDRALWSEGFEHDQRRAESAEAERDDLRARLAKVEALIEAVGGDEARHACDDADADCSACWIHDLRAALGSVPEPSDERAIPKRCPRCGEECRYDGWDWTHASCYGVGSCPEPSDSEPAPDADREAGGE
ncbi:MAG TPA: hypothetical protein VHO27_01475 [Angustibacter sp.]|nr:hypothetical protein [Angustibacter sp.]